MKHFVLTTNEIVTLADTLKKMANARLTGKPAYLAYRNLSKVAKIADDFEKARNELILKYGEKDGEQTVVRKGSENYPKFVEEITEILTQPEEVDLYQISEDELEKFADADLTMSDFAVIDTYLVERPEPEKKEEAPAEGDTAPTEG